MDYLNTNFTSIDDLDILDEKISSLEAFKSEVLSIVKLRVEREEHGSQSRSGSISTSEHRDVDLPAADNSAESVLKVIEQICSPDQDTSKEYPDFQALRDQYGSLAVFDQLSTSFQQRKEYESAIELLHEFQRVEQDAVRHLPVDGTEIEKFQNAYNLLTAIMVRSRASTSFAAAYEIILKQYNSKVIAAKNSLQYKLDSALTSINWLAPSFTGEIPPATLASIQSIFDSIITLQSINHLPSYPDTWWGIDSLIKPFVTRFQYHFVQPNKPTNKIAKPEWCLEYMETFLNENLVYLEMIIGDKLLTKTFNRFVAYEIITSLLVPVRSKMVHSAQQINRAIEQQEAQHHEKVARDSKIGGDFASGNSIADSELGRLLSHLIFEISSFDQRLRSKYKYDPSISNYTAFNASENGKWMGLIGDIILNKDQDDLEVVASNWLNIESQLAKKRFHKEILNSENAFEIDFDFKGSTTTTVKPTYSAYNLFKLFENLTSHYKTLNIVKYQWKYVSTIQLDLVDLYCDEITRQFKKINSKSVLQYMPKGISSKSKRVTSGDATAVSPLTTLKLLCQLYCSAKFINEKMELWSEDLIFIQLWTQFQKISSTAASFPKDSTIFDDSIGKYSLLTGRIFDKIEDFLTKEVKTLLKSYVNETKWDVTSVAVADSRGNIDISDDLEVSVDLALFCNTLPDYLHYLTRSFSSIDYYMFSGKVCSIVYKTLKEFVITNNTFTEVGVKQLKLDFDYVHQVFGRSLYINGTSTDDTSEGIPEKFYDNTKNLQYLKVSQSIELLNGVKTSEVRVFGAYDTYPALRERFDSRLNVLNDFEIFDLLHRLK